MHRTWSIQEIAKLSGITSRTLRHYDAIGLLAPTEIGANGNRRYDAQALIRLQRILVLRDLGVPLADICAVLDDEADSAHALRNVLARLRQEARRRERQMASIESTIAMLETGGELMADEMFAGWDNSQYESEVRERYGDEAWNASASWWDGKSPEEKRLVEQQAQRLMQDWQTAARSGEEPAGERGQELAARQIAWLAGIPGVPVSGDAEGRQVAAKIAKGYVDDPRFWESYGGKDVVTFLHDAMQAYAER